MEFAKIAQIVLLVFYGVLAIAFAKTKEWPISIYYAGCLVKDLSVYILAFFSRT